jgi:hypothetical protein
VRKEIDDDVMKEKGMRRKRGFESLCQIYISPIFFRNCVQKISNMNQDRKDEPGSISVPLEHKSNALPRSWLLSAQLHVFAKP